MSKIQELLRGRDDQLDADAILARQPWITTRGNKCILSPDSDGLLCGLFMSHFFNWEVIGFYDGKVLALRDGESCYSPDTAFLDMEIARTNVRSVGHHMLLWNKRSIPAGWEQRFSHCIQPNLIRGYDGNRDFRLKYPLATIHFLIALLASEIAIEVPKSAIAPLLFTDGTFNVLYKYPENVLNWLNFLGIQNGESPLREIFMHEHFTVYTLMLEMDEFFRRRDRISVAGERGDRLRISESDGTPFNLPRRSGEMGDINEGARRRVVEFTQMLADATGWEYRPDRWSFAGLRVFPFEKDSFQNQGRRVNNGTFEGFIAQDPLSWAMTSGTNIEFTLESPSQLP